MEGVCPWGRFLVRDVNWQTEGAEGLPGRTESGLWYVKLDALES